jgi:segregation and condensation protein A
MAEQEDTVSVSQSTNDHAFEEDLPREAAEENETLLLTIDGFEGPIDVLLHMARTQKVDLAQISILQLARQYLAFIDQARQKRLDLAAEYLVMAAWLAYMKSRLLVPADDSGGEEGEASGEAMAEALAFQLRRLEAMQDRGEKLMQRPQLGVHIFRRGMPEGLPVHRHHSYDARLYDMLHAYGHMARRHEQANYNPRGDFTLMATEDAVARMEAMLGQLPRSGRHSVWTTLTSLLPAMGGDRLYARSALASMLTASLEKAKQGELEIRQEELFAPVYLRAADVGEEQGRQDTKNDV